MIESIAQALAAFFALLTKATPPDEIRVNRQQIRLPRLHERERKRLFQRAFRWLKKHPENDVATYVDYMCDALDLEDRQELIQLLTERLKKP